VSDLPYLPYEPDKGPFSGSSSDSVLNVLPVANGYGPFKSLNDVSEALEAACTGAIYARTTDGNFRIIAATVDKFWLYNAGTNSFDDITGGTAPNVPDGDLVQFVQFGSLVIAVGLGWAPQKFNIDAGGVFADLGGSPPQARYVWRAGDYVVLGYLSGAPRSIQWCGTNNAEFWTNGDRGADIQALPDGDEIMGGFSFTGGARIIQRRAKRAMTFAPGTGLTFRIDDVDAAKGSVAPFSIVPIGQTDYVYLAEDGWYRGDQGLPIGAERVDRTFLADCDAGQLELVQGALNPYTKMVWWVYTDGSAVRKMLGYNWQLDKWTRSDESPALLVSMITPGYTLEDLDQFGDLDSLPASLDSRIWKGGRPAFAAFTSDFKLAYFEGTNAQAVLETASTELNPGSRTFVSGARLIGNADDFTMKVAGRATHGAADSYSSAVAPSSATGIVPFRSSALLHRFQTTIAAGDVWSHAHGVRVNHKREGQR
jgi:hypothetical protein